jgi:outer membrane protein assembly factor BamA
MSAQTGPTVTPAQTPTSEQTKEVLPSYEGQNVSSVEIAGQPDMDTSRLLSLVAQKPNQPFSQAKVNDSIAALRSAGRFDDVELQVRPEPQGVRVLLTLEPAVYFGMYEFPGAEKRFEYSRLLQVSDYPPRGAYSQVDVANAQKALERFLQREGYFRSDVSTQVQTDRVHGLANIYFNTTLGRKAKFGTVTLTGADAKETAHLQGVLRSFRARLRNASIRTGKTYSLRRLQNATTYLQNALMKEDHLNAKVKLISADYNSSTNRADITFSVESGPVYRVTIQGARVWSWTRKDLLPVYEGVGIDQEIIEEGRTNLVSHFQQKGFFDVKVDVTTQSQSDGESILYQVTKGRRHRVSSVGIAGNETLENSALMPHVVVKKARIPFFSHGSYSQKLVRTSVKNLENIYRANGFSDARVTPEVHTQSGNVQVTFQVTEGERDIVETMNVEGNDTRSISDLAPQGLNLAPGRPYSQELVHGDRNTMMASYLRLGYLNASFRQQVRPGKEKHRVEVTYIIDEGPQVRTAKVVTLGRRTTQQALVNRVAPIPVGAPLRQDEMLRGENQLYGVGVFDWAQIAPRRRITTQSQEDVLLKLHEGKKNDLTYGFGFDVINKGGSIPSGTVVIPGLPAIGLNKNFETSQKTYWGPRGLIEYTRRNLWGKAETMSFSALAARLDQRGTITYTDPYFLGTDWTSSASIYAEHDEQNPVFSAVTGQAGYQLQHALNPDKTMNIFLRYSYSQTGLTNIVIPDLVPPEDQHVRLSTLSSTFVRDTRDFPLDAHKGIYETVVADFNPRSLGSNFNFAKILAQTAYYKQISDKRIIWANSVRLGFAVALTGHVPLSQKFFTGGGSTIRGFPLNGAGPQRQVATCPTGTTNCQDFITVPEGGNQLLIVNSEFRIPVPLKQGLGVVPFYDGGNVFPVIGFHGQYTNTAGFGFRYATPVGPIRVDFGYNLNAPPGLKSFQYFITIGQAF